MEKYKYLFKNIGLLTISNFGTKILSFLLVPLYTAILSTGEYGTYDLVNTTVSLLMPIMTISITDGVLRYSLDQNNDRNQIFTIGIKVIVQGFVILCAFVLINHIFVVFQLIDQYWFFFLLMYGSTTFYTFISGFVRGIDEIPTLSVAGVLNTVAILAFNILFLVALHLGLPGYFFANILGALVPSVYCIAHLHLWEYWEPLIPVDRRLRHEMFEYSHPLIWNSLGWWANSAADRYVVIAFAGINANGIYSVGYKIPSILNMLANIFNQAWVLSSVHAFDPDDSDGFFSNIYALYNMLLVVSCSFLIVTTKVFAKVLYANQFYQAWKYVPFLLIAMVFGAIAGFVGGIFSAAKDSKIYSISTILGALINIGLNLALVPFIGAIGAAIATMISYLFVWILRMITVRKHMQLRIRIFRDSLGYIILLLQSLLLLTISSTVFLYSIQSALFISILILYRRDIAQIIKKLVK